MIFKSKQTGTALIVVTIMVVLITGISFALFFTSSYHYSMNRANQSNISCEYANKGSIQIASMLLSKLDSAIDKKPVRIEGRMGDTTSFIYMTVDQADPYNPSAAWKRVVDDTPVDGSGTTPADEVFNAKDEPLIKSRRASGSFRVEIFDQDGSPLTTSGKLADITPIQVKTYALADNSISSLKAYLKKKEKISTQTVTVPKDVVTSTTTTTTLAIPGIIGYREVLLQGNGIVDSFDGKVGPYGPGNQNENGDVGSNGTVSTDGNGAVKGDVVHGTGFSGDTSDVTGAIIKLKEPMPEPTVLDDSGKNIKLTTPNSNISKPGASVTLGSSGQTTNLHFSSLSIKANVTIKGNVNIFVDGAVTANAQGNIKIEDGAKLTITLGGKGTLQYNGGFESNGKAESFVIRSLNDQRAPNNTGSTLVFNGGSDIAAVVDAPFSNIKIAGNNEFFGVVIGQRVLVTGSPGPSGRKFHYDESIQAAQVQETTTTTTTAIASVEEVKIIDSVNYFVNTTIKNAFIRGTERYPVNKDGDLGTSD